MTETDASETSAGPPGGRPRSESVRAGILAATYDLLLEAGLASLTVEAVAHRAGASKATVYRWWSSKGSLAVDAIFERTRRIVVFDDTGDARADLSREIQGVVDFFTGTPDGAAVLDVIAQGRLEPDIGSEFRRRIIGPASELAANRIDRARAAGQLPEGLSSEFVIDVLWGPIYYHLLVSAAPLAPGYVDSLLDLVFPRP